MKIIFIKYLNSVLGLFFIFCGFYVAVLLALYFFQEKLIFFPDKLKKDYQFSFNAKFEEINLTTLDGEILNGLHFYAKNPKGAVLFFHGNTNDISRWGGQSDFWLNLGYDFFVFDYRGFGKSSGEIRSENELYEDANLMFERVLKDFKKDEIVVLGYSIGSGISAKVAENFGISKLILVSPYFNFKDLASSKFPFVPSFSVKYEIPTNEFISNFTQNSPNSQILIFHGKNDDLIEISNARNLAKLLKKDDKLYELDSGHNDILYDIDFINIITKYFH